jgi:hypothetical protein
MLRAAESGRIDRPIFVERKGGPNLALRLVAIRKPEKAAAEARRKARRDAQREGYQVSKKTLEAADWVILLPSHPIPSRRKMSLTSTVCDGASNWASNV